MFKTGKRPVRHDKRTLWFANYFKTTPAAVLPTAPDPVDYTPALKDSGVPLDMYGNDEWGDCFWAMGGNAIRVWSANAGKIIVPTKDDVLAGYETTGFDPNAGPSDNNPTDQGTDMLSGLNTLRKVGIGGQKIGAYMAVNPKNQAEVLSALYLFGTLLIGVEFLENWMNTHTWDIDGGKVDGGHAICGVTGATKDGITVISWADYYTITWAAVQKYCDEMYVTLAPQWLIEGTNTAPNHIDIPTLTADLALVTK